MTQKTYNGGWNVVEIRDFLVDNYTVEQLYSLGRRLAGKDWNDLEGTTLSDYSRSLILYCKSRGLHNALLQALQQSPDNPSDGTVTQLQYFYGDARNIQEVYAFLAQYDLALLHEIATNAGLRAQNVGGVSTRAYAENLVDACARRGAQWYSILLQVMQA